MADDQVLIGCKHQGGLNLAVYRRSSNGDPPRSLGVICLAGSRTMVSRRLWEEWFAENKMSSLVTSGAIYEIDSV